MALLNNDPSISENDHVTGRKRDGTLISRGQLLESNSIDAAPRQGPSVINEMAIDGTKIDPVGRRRADFIRILQAVGQILRNMGTQYGLLEGAVYSGCFQADLSIDEQA